MNDGLSTFEKITILAGVGQVNALGERFPRVAAGIIGLMVDQGPRLYWSRARIGRRLGVAPRTVSRALAWLRGQGFLVMRQRRRKTAEFSLRASILLAAIRGGLRFFQAQATAWRAALPRVAKSCYQLPKSYNIDAPPSAALLKTRLVKEALNC